MQKYELWIEENLFYEPETGHLVWKRGGPGHRAGTFAGYYWIQPNGTKRTKIKIRGRHFPAATIVWWILHREWIWGLDHIDRDATNNRETNLRKATAVENRRNSTLVRSPRDSKGRFTISSKGSKESEGAPQTASSALA